MIVLFHDRYDENGLVSIFELYCLMYSTWRFIHLPQNWPAIIQYFVMNTYENEKNVFQDHPKLPLNATHFHSRVIGKVGDIFLKNSDVCRAVSHIMCSTSHVRAQFFLLGKHHRNLTSYHATSFYFSTVSCRQGVAQEKIQN